ncbi:UDP-3-O-(3-hydroxymyristoyl)glucosamine N-acyltransferase [Silvibacterium dinghuense]|uniref:UDP-3-O-acylglucosamine N-acyltransferase n=1 Tax=Silvibacterium dinghuense TaxID=1560006 RepID=A0A4Q1SDT9_9BACT|nr:UDP-3-O-(3-hydroxymyristoyl)glucosamine N-acyltransferase [Silvibacterium dinghuense]RXS95267.1 UDP-3-O-(3-hydroxymyristoyl)glucosamine N-acyltransferase [Silvibacterium dinghuense]GGH11981.1 UDP-3-O-acylglucosamine N-acyltransferase 2 [Silvibacterium dinghuense]
MKLAELALLLDAELHGNGDLEVNGVAGIEHAGPDQVTFVANSRYTALARTTAAAAVVVAPDFPEISAATLRLKNPYFAWSKAIRIFHPDPVYAPGIHPSASIHPTATIGKDAHIGAFVAVEEGAVIGDHAVLLPHAVIYPYAVIGDHFFAHAHSVVREHCRIGNHVVLQNGVVVGCDGFGFAKDNAGAWQKIPQPGPVVIGDHVEIQANSCIDRASVGETRIDSGVKVDNLVQVGHGSSVGEHTLLCAQVGLAGSSEIGRNAILAGQAGVAGHCRLGDGVIMTAQSGVSHDVPDGKMISGSPAFDNRQWLRSTAIFTRLPDIVRQLQKRDKPEKTNL